VAPLKSDKQKTNSQKARAALSQGLQTQRRKWAFRLGALLVPIVLLAIVEGGLRLVGYGYPTGFFLKSRAQGRQVLVENQQVAWRYFPPGLARSPQPLAIPAPKPADMCRIFVFGESAAMGDPEPAFGFPRILKVLLQARHPGKRFEVVNVAMTAINSHVIHQIAHDCSPRQGDLWVIYMGNNEVVGPFGAGTVFGAQAPGLAFIRASLAVKSARTGQWIDALWHRLKSGKPAEWEGMEMFLQQQVREDNPRMARVYEHFQKNLKEILDVGLASGAKVLLSTVASNLKDCPPFGSLHRAGLTASQRAEWEKLYQAAIRSESATNYNDAISVYQQAAQVDNQFAELFFRIGRCQSGLGRDAEARQSFEQARDLDTLRFRADTRINRAIRAAQSRGGDGLRLLDAVEVLANNSPQQIPGQKFFFEHVHFNFDGNYLLARSMVEQIEASWPALLGASANSSEPLLSREECARRLGFSDWNRYQIMDEMSRRLRQPPFSRQLDHGARDERLEKARAALQPAVTGDGVRQSIEVYRAALGIAPDDWILHENFAKLLQSTGDPPGAEEQWRKVVALMPHYEQAYYSLGNVLDAQGKSGEALDYLRRAVRRRPDSLEAHNGLGLALANQGKTDEAMREYEATLRRKPAFSEARVNLGQLLAEQGKIDQAMAQYESALRFNSNSAAAHINLGKLLAQRKEFSAAAEHYQAALGLKPDNAIAHYNLGNALANLGQTNEAMSHFAEAVRCQPGFAEAHFNFGMQLAGRGKTAEALEHFSEAVRLKPDFVEAHLNLGVALAKLRKFEPAIQQFQETLRLDPENVAAKRFLDAAVRAGGAGVSNQ